MTGDKPGTVILTADQGARLMAICALIKQGDLDVRGDDEEDVDNARDALFDVGEECALQFGGLITPPPYDHPGDVA